MNIHQGSQNYWMVVRTNNHKEHFVATRLREMEVDVFEPVMEVRRRGQVMEKPLLSNYIFARYSNTSDVIYI